MKVGILTFHDADNYGAVLQCFALQEVLKTMGCNVDVINYKQPHIVDLYRTRTEFSLQDLAHITPQRFMAGVKKLLQLSFNRKRHSFFQQFRKEYLNITHPCTVDSIPNDYDVYIVGSDQMWSYACCGGIDPVYWGDFYRSEASRLIGYAISGNGDFTNYLSADEISKKCSNFTDLSFREIKLRDLIESLTSKVFSASLDPTLLTNENIWVPLLKETWRNRKFVVVYQARVYKKKPKAILKKAQDYAKAHNLDVVNLSDSAVSINDFISAIKFADCVFTSSFHATVFSVIFGTPFYSFVLNDGKDERYVNFLEQLQLTKHAVPADQKIEEKILIDKDNVSYLLSQLSKQSLAFLYNSINDSEYDKTT